LAVAFAFPDRGERVRVTLKNSVLLQELGSEAPVTATATLPRPAFLALLFGGRNAAELVQAGILTLDGDVTALQGLLGSLDGPATAPFAIVTP
jgi:alkyl sulfatase BDS1-like metallo-beta-lactamase superfamily hydrolase